MTELDDQSSHEIQAIRILGGFQVLEFTLKLYIAAAYTIIRDRINGDFPFLYDFKHIENFPLEKVSNIFSRLNSNADLHSRINKLRDKRNDVAHRSLMYRHEIICHLLKVNLSSHLVDLTSTESELNTCLELMALELDMIVSKDPNHEA